MNGVFSITSAASAHKGIVERKVVRKLEGTRKMLGLLAISAVGVSLILEFVWQILDERFSDL